MSSDDKYFYIKPVESNARRSPHLSKWNSQFVLSIEVDVDFRQHIDLNINKLPSEKWPKPSSDKFTKVKPVIKEVFLSHYNLAIKYIHELIIDEGEFYLLKHSSDWFEVKYFPANEKNKWCIDIDFRDSVEDLWLMVYSNPGQKSRPEARKKGIALTVAEFRQFLNLTLQFFSDSDSLSVFLDDYIRNIKILSRGGEGNHSGFLISGEKIIEEALNQLRLRRVYLEKRLMENDNDSVIERSKIRGELDGINYSMNILRDHQMKAEQS